MSSVPEPLAPTPTPRPAPTLTGDGGGSRAREIALGLLALFVVLLNVVWHVQHGRWFESFWLCNLSLALVGAGLLARSSLGVSVGFAWLIPGTLAWSIEASLLGGTFAPTSYAVHLGGSALATFGVARLGVHRRTELAALTFLAAALLLARGLPASANVNCAFGARAGWRVLPSSGALFFALGTLGAVAASLLSTLLARKIAGHTRASVPRGLSRGAPGYGAGLAPP
jgi:hypothetical protein